MGTRERPVDRGTERGRDLIRSGGREIRQARRALGLSLREVSRTTGLSIAAISRTERGLVPNVSVINLARLCAVVGLELSLKAFPSGQPIRDAGHVRLLQRLRASIHPSLSWRTEVPLSIAGDARAWDAMVTGRGWRYGVEAETRPLDGQALARRIALKLRDGRVDGVVLLLPDTRQSRIFRREFGPLLAVDFTVESRQARDRLAVGIEPGGNAVIVMD